MRRRSIALLVCMAAGLAHAEMHALADAELAGVHGAGLGLVLEQFRLDAAATRIVINDITNAAGQNMPITVREFYLGAAGSNKGSTLAPVTLGRLAYPFSLNVARGEDLRSLVNGNWVRTTPTNVSVFELAFPPQLLQANGGQPCLVGTGINLCSSRASERFDAGLLFELQATSGRTDVFNFDLADAVMDGSYLRLWGNATQGQLVGELRLNLFARGLDLMSCQAGGLNCTSAALQNERTIYATNLVASLALGYGRSQPLLLDVTSNGQFVFELPNPVRDPANPNAAVDTLGGVGRARAEDFYANAPRTSFSVDNLNVGGNRAGVGAVPTGGVNLGSSQITGLSFNFLKVTSRDL